jgi:hypothetical protein
VHSDSTLDTSATGSKSLADAVAFKERLLLFDKTSAARTQVYYIVTL